MMFKTTNLGRNLLIALILSVFVLPVANAGLVEIYINDSEELTESEEEFVIRSGKNLDLEIRLSGAYRIDSGDENLSVESIYIDVYFDSDTDRRDSTSGLPQYKSHEGLDPGYDRFISAFKGDDTRFEGYEGPIRFSIIMKNSSSGIVRDSVIIITMEAPPSESNDSSGFSLSIPEEVTDYWELILGGIVGFFILSFGIYKLILAPEDTTADVYRTKESIDPLKKSLTGVGYESELPSESKLHRLENRKEDPEEEDDEIDLEDDDEEDDFDESKLLAELTGSQPLKDTSEDEDSEPAEAPKKKAVKKKVAKKTIAKKKIVRKAAPPKTTEPDVNMGQGIIKITCPSCEKVHNVEDTTSRFICSCGRRIRV
jgi:hypothetical protein